MKIDFKRFLKVIFYLALLFFIFGFTRFQLSSINFFSTVSVTNLSLILAQYFCSCDTREEKFAHEANLLLELDLLLRS